MVKCDTEPCPVTWDMSAQKLDTELETSKSVASPGEDENLLRYFRVMTTYMHRCLKNYQVPPFLYSAVYSRPKVLGEICHFWMDEVGRRGGDTRDKDGIALISVINWMKQICLEDAAPPM